MVTPVPGRTVPVPPPLVHRQQVVQGAEQILLGARTGLDDRYPGGGVRHVDVQQPVALSRHERLRLRGDVPDGRTAAGRDGDDFTAHRLSLPVTKDYPLVRGRCDGVWAGLAGWV